MFHATSRACLAALLLLAACSSNSERPGKDADHDGDGDTSPGDGDPLPDDGDPMPDDGDPMPDDGDPMPDDGDSGPDQPDASAPDGSVEGDGGETDGPAAKITFTFEPLTLEGGPVGLTDFAFIPGTMQFIALQKGDSISMGIGASVFHYEIDGDTAKLLGKFRVPRSYERHDCGLISVAFDPEFATNKYVYFAYCDSHDYSTVSRHVFDPGDDYASIAATDKSVLRVGEDGAPNAWHNVGDIGFDGDGNLWALFGEKNDSEQAQDLGNALGTVVRVKPRRGADEEGYVVVEENPFAAMDDKHDDIVAYGLRSPWRGAIDSRNRLWIGDVGDTKYEEINLLSSWNGDNFGWPLSEGACKGDCNGQTDPLVYWSHDLTTWAAMEDPEAEATTRRSSWVGIEYAGTSEDRYDGRLTGRMLYGDFCGGWVRAIEVDGNGQVVYDGHAGHLPTAVGWAEATDGYVYALTYGNCFTGPHKPSGLYRSVLAEP